MSRRIANYRTEIMFSAGTQRGKYIDALRRTDTLLEYAVQHGMTEEAERLREVLRRLSGFDESVSECKPVGDGHN